MELIQYTLNWVKGEITESLIMAAFGGLIVLCSLLLWRYGTTAYARVLVIPFVVVGIIPLVMGGIGAIANKNSLPLYKEAWHKDKQQFAINEKERVENFDQIFKYTYPMAAIFTIGGAVLFFLVDATNWKAISLAMMTLGLMAYIIDYFAANRAEVYLEHIKRAIE